MAITVGLTLFLVSCKNGPQVDECLQTIYDCDPIDKTMCHIVADCIHPDGKPFEKHGTELDGNYSYTPEDRQTIILWAKQRCSK